MVSFWFKKILSAINYRPYLQYYLVFVLAFLLFAFLQNTPGMADPDSYYHVAMARQIAEQGVPREFPYLPYTVFTNYFTDHHLLYHIALVPFVTFLDPVAGAKLAQTLFASLAVLTFYWLLKKLKVPFAGFFTLALCLTSPFIFRISLIKVPALSILVLLLAIYLIIEKNRRLLGAPGWLWLALLSFFFVWLYGGFLLVVILTGIFVFWEGVLFGFKERHALKSIFKKWFSQPLLPLSLAAIGGVSLGVIINPYFPQNLTFYWEQVIQIGLINYGRVIGVGGEWYPYGFGELIAGTAFVWILVIGALTLAIINWRKLTPENLALFVFACMFLIFTLKSRRYVEYFVPFTLLWTGVALRDSLADKFNWQNLSAWAKDYYRTQKAFAVTLIVYLVIGVPLLSYRYVSQTKRGLQGYPPSRYAGAGQWLNKNSRQQIIFHNDWDDFPFLFFHDPSNYYIVGLDPTFMYKYNQELYWQWVNITLGKQKENLYETIKNDFKSSFVFVDSEHQGLEDNLKNDGRFRLVYQDEETRIYQL